MCKTILVVVVVILNMETSSTQQLLGNPTPTSSYETTYSDYMSKLSEELYKTYDRNRRPVKNESQLTSVQTHGILEHVEEVNELQQTLAFHGTFYQTWSDEFLKWDPDNHGNVSRFYTPGWKIWKPELFVLNSALGKNAHREFAYYWSRFEVKNYGYVIGFVRFSFKVTCLFDYSNYPYDVQECGAKILPYSQMTHLTNFGDSDGSQPSINTHFEANYNSDDKNRKKKKLHVTGWYLEQAWQNVTVVPNNEDSLSTYLHLHLKLRRHAPYFGVMVLLPAVVTSLVTLSVFWISSVTNAIYISVMSMLIQGFATRDLLMKIPPSTESTPKIIVFYGLNLGLTFSALLVVLLAKTLQSLTTPLPQPVTLLFKKIPSVLLWIKPVTTESNSGSKSEENVEEPENQESGNSMDVYETGERHIVWPVIADFLRFQFGIIFAVIYFSILIACFRKKIY